MQVTYTDNIIIAGFHALSDPLRIKVLQLLRKQEMCVCDLCDVLQASQSKLSFHLKNLREADERLCSSRRTLDLLQSQFGSVPGSRALPRTIPSRQPNIKSAFL